MKVYISADIEGVAGISDTAHVTAAGGAEYRTGCELMTAETNAAIEGALKAGATEFVVNDSHGLMRNLIPEALHPSATLIQGKVKPWYMVEGLDSSFDAVFFVGYHAAAGVPDGILNHAYHPYELRYNGQIWSEIGINASVAGHLGVPVVLVTGDDATLRDAQACLPPHRGVSVKRGISRFACESVHPSQARSLIKAGAAESLHNINDYRPLKVTSPISVEVDFYYSHQADVAALIPTTRRVSDRTVAFEADDPLQAYRTFVATNFITRNLV